jgi:hypothetical protein
MDRRLSVWESKWASTFAAGVFIAGIVVALGPVRLTHNSVQPELTRYALGDRGADVGQITSKLDVALRSDRWFIAAYFLLLAGCAMYVRARAVSRLGGQVADFVVAAVFVAAGADLLGDFCCHTPSLELRRPPPWAQPSLRARSSSVARSSWRWPRSPPPSRSCSEPRWVRGGQHTGAVGTPENIGGTTFSRSSQRLTQVVISKAGGPPTTCRGSPTLSPRAVTIEFTASACPVAGCGRRAWRWEPCKSSPRSRQLFSGQRRVPDSATRRS